MEHPVYDILTLLSILVWVAFLTYCVPAVIRVVRGGYHRADLSATVSSAYGFLVLGYRAVGMMFGSVDRYGEAELLARSALAFLSIAIAFVCYLVLRQYRRYRPV